MNNETRLALMIQLCESLNRTEAEVRLLGIDVPDSPMPLPISGDSSLAFVYAQDIVERFFGWNRPLLSLEAHLEPLTSIRKHARRVGCNAHDWYEASKQLTRSVGFVVEDPAMRTLYLEAYERALKGNVIARKFLEWRNTHTPITLVARK